MAVPIVLPRLGWTMEEGTLVQWLKQDGDSIQVGDKLFVMEGDKATEEIEAIDAGVLRVPPDAPAEGTVMAVGTVLAFICAPEETPPWLATPAATVQASSAAAGASAAALPAAAVSAALGGAGSVSSAATIVESAATRGPRHSASPRARRRARQLGIDLGRVVGTGATGRVRESDVLAAAKNTASANYVSPAAAPARPLGTHASTAPATLDAGPCPLPAGTTITLSSMRKTIGQRMVSVLQQSAPVTLTRRVDATNLVSLRRQFQATQGEARADAFVPSYTELIGRVVAAILASHPELNAVWKEQDLIQASDVHLAVAVSTSAGLVVPVIRHAQQLGLREFVRVSRQLVELARAGRLTVEQQTGGTFTISNLGMEGVDLFTPIINPPQVAILGVGRITREAVWVQDEVVGRDQMWLSLTFDHRATDGAPAARLLTALARAIENPSPHLV